MLAFPCWPAVRAGEYMSTCTHTKAFNTLLPLGSKHWYGWDAKFRQLCVEQAWLRKCLHVMLSHKKEGLCRKSEVTFRAYISVGAPEAMPISPLLRTRPSVEVTSPANARTGCTPRSCNRVTAWRTPLIMLPTTSLYANLMLHQESYCRFF